MKLNRSSGKSGSLFFFVFIFCLLFCQCDKKISSVQIFHFRPAILILEAKNIELYSHVVLSDELLANIENYYLIDSTRLPSVEIFGCTVTANIAWGFLIKTRNVLIEHNLIMESTGTGIYVGAEGSWHEEPISENVIIHYNRIIRCGTGVGTIDGVVALLSVSEPKKLMFPDCTNIS